MGNTTYVFLHRVKVYFRVLWIALRGRDAYREERDALSRRLDAAEANVRKLQDMYASALDKWQHDQQLLKQEQDLIKQMEDRDTEKVATYQKLVETLRSTINDKERKIDELNREFGEQLKRLERKDNK